MKSAVRPEAILRQLYELWGSLGANHQDETKPSGVLRACAMTLVVVTRASENPARLSETLGELMRDHPSRAVVLRLRESPAAFLDARVLAQCWMPSGRRVQICSEQIEIEASASSLSRIPSIILAVTAPDLPVVLWCRDTASCELEASRKLASMSDKLVLDSAGFENPRHGLARMSAACREGHITADLSWTRLTPWRRIIAQTFENPARLEECNYVSEIQISSTGEETPAIAYYLAGWLVRALEWSLEGNELRSRRGECKVRFRARKDEMPGEIREVRLMGSGAGADDIFLSVSLKEGSFIEVQMGAIVHRAAFPPLTDCALLREELSIRRRDTVYEECLALAKQTAEAGLG